MPIKIPPSGLVAVPLPNNRRSPTARADFPVGEPISRRTKPSCAHINGATAGADGPPNGCAAKPDTSPAAARATTAFGTLTNTLDGSGAPPCADGVRPATALEVAPSNGRRREDGTAKSDVEGIAGTTASSATGEPDDPGRLERDALGRGNPASASPRSEPADFAAADRGFPDRADLSRFTPSDDPDPAGDPAGDPEAELDRESAPESAVSANATPGIEATAAPTPTATATAPTRPR